MAAPPPGADVQDGAGPPPQGSPSPEGSLRAPFPALVVGEPLVPPPAPSSWLAHGMDGSGPPGRHSRPPAAAGRSSVTGRRREGLEDGQRFADRAGAAGDDRV